MKRRKVVHYRRTVRRLTAAYHDETITRAALNASIQGWINHVRYGDTWGLRRAILKDVVL